MGALLPVILNLSSGAEDVETAEKVREAFRSAGAEVEVQRIPEGGQIHTVQ